MNPRPMIPDIVRANAAAAPEARAFTYLTDGECSDAVITRGALDLRARAIAAELQAREAGGAPVIILMPSGLEFIAALLGCWYAGAIAVPAPVPRGRKTEPRVWSILGDAQPRVAIASEAVRRRIESLDGAPPGVEWLDVTIDDPAANSWTEPDLHDGAVALLQYTSGSTGDPRGVMLTHGNILENQRMIQAAFDQTTHSVIFGWLPLHHDMGLIGNVVQPLFLGAPCILMSPAHFVQKPLRWLQGISRYRAATSGGPNSAYDLCIDSVTEDQVKDLDLSSWTVAFNGAEPVRAVTLERFSRKFAAAGFRRGSFRPCYGLAEATLLVSGSPGRPTSAAAARPVGCGCPLPPQEAVVVDPSTHSLCPPSVSGEIWVSGPNVGIGYWRRPQETAATFHARLAGANERTYLRTGDLGLMADGELFITGRMKDVIILRGCNLHPEDIEAALDGCHAALVRGACAAFAASGESGETLVVVHEVRTSNRSELQECILAIRRAVASSHEVQAGAVILIRVGSIPRTSSGKVRRGRCKEDYETGKLAVIATWDQGMVRSGSGSAPRDPVEEVIAVLWAQCLCLESVGVHEMFLDLGGDSLSGLRIIGNVLDIFQVQISMEDLLENPTVVTLAAQVREMQNAAAAPKPVTDAPAAEGFVPLSAEQQPVWTFEQLFPGTAAYIIPVVLRIAGPLDAGVFEKSVQALVERHRALRSAIGDEAGVSVQKISANPIQVSLIDLSGEPDGVETRAESLVDAEATKPFDLRQGPLVRVTLIRLGPELHVCAFVMHHLVCDNESIRILLRDLAVFYNQFLRGRAPVLPDLAVQPTGTKPSPAGARRGAAQPLDLEADRPAPRVPRFVGAAQGANLEPEVASGLMRMARGERVTLSTVLLASFSAFLHRYTGEREFVLGCPISTRSRIESEHAVGLFAEAVPVAFRFEDHTTFRDLLRQTHAAMLAGWSSRPGTGAAPAAGFQVLYSFLNQSGLALPLVGVQTEIMPHHVRSCIPDLCLSVMRRGPVVRCDFEHRTELFDRGSISLMLAKYLLLLNALVREPGRAIVDCEFLLPEERALADLLPLEVTL